MSDLFDIERNKVIVHPTLWALPAMKALYDRDKDKDKINAFREASYIIFMYAFKSPYRDFKWDEKERDIIKDVFKGAKWKPDKAVEEAIKAFRTTQNTRSTRMLQAAYKAADKITDWFEKVDLEEEDFTGKPKYSVNDVSRNLKEIGNIIKSLHNLDKQVRLELEETSVRGNTELGLFEEPDEDDAIDTTFEAD